MSPLVRHSYPCLIRFTLKFKRFRNNLLRQIFESNCISITLALIRSTMRFWFSNSDPISMAIFRKLPAQQILKRRQIFNVIVDLFIFRCITNHCVHLAHVLFHFIFTCIVCDSIKGRETSEYIFTVTVKCFEKLSELINNSLLTFQYNRKPSFVDHPS